MPQEQATLNALIATAATIALVHTAVGIDHTLPFVALARARAWSLSKLWGVVTLCGLGHVGASIVLGSVGIGLNVAVERLVLVEGTRGHWASLLLIVFGLLLVVRGVMRTRRKRSHSHVHVHGDGVVHAHPHDHVHPAHRHPHVERGVQGLGVWGLFVIFVFGPCEPLIPLLMAPAALHAWTWVVAVVVVFAAVTIGVMLAIVTAAHLGLRRLALGPLERHAEALSGVAIALSGVAVQVLGI